MGIDGGERISGSCIDAANGAHPWVEVAGTLAALAWSHPRSQGNALVIDRERQLFRAYEPSRGELTRAGVISSPVLSLAM